jgi:GNAT superfamily N-acetyltransferase
MHPGVREARESDLDRIQQLIIDLAKYERAAHEVKTTIERLRVALFGPQPAAYALVAESDNQVVGFALYFRNFSTWEGVHGIYLEDLCVMPEYRGSGLGRAFANVSGRPCGRAGIRQAGMGCSRLEPARYRLLPDPGCGRDGRMDRLSTDRRGAYYGGRGGLSVL